MSGRPVAVAVVLFLAVAVRGGAGQGPAPRQPRVPTAISDRVQRGERVPVIIRLATTGVVRPEGALSAGQVAQQRGDIARVQQRLTNVLAATGVNSRRFQTIPYVAARLNARGLAALAASAVVERVEEDHLATIELTESIPLVGANTVWSNGYTGSGWTVAVIDTGVEKAHSFLSGKVVSEACYSNGGLGGTSVCPDGSRSSTAIGSAVPCTGSSCDHGTHVAGIVAGSGSSFSGVAKDASLIAIQVFTRFSDGSLSAYFSDINAALERVYTLRGTYNIAAVNMSLGGSLYSSTAACDAANSSTKAVIDNLRSAGIATVIASGNNGSGSAIAAPGCISTAISVGSTTDTTDQISSFTNTASFLSVLAPGQVITSSVLNGTFGEKSGTSMATPHVAGAWALMKQVNSAASVPDVLTALQNTGVRVTDPLNGLVFPRIALVCASVAVSPFTDDPLISGVTSVRVVHVTELRRQVDCLRERYGLPAMSWTDSTMAAGVTVIRAIHLTELRSALDAAYVAAGRPAPTYSDHTLAGVIKAIDIRELRTAVSSLW